MREYPWISREPGWDHLRRYRLIATSLGLVARWVEVTNSPPSFLLRKGLTPGYDSAQPLLRHLEGQASVGELEFPDSLLGAQTPDEFLDLLSKAVRVQQALVLDQILRRQGEAGSEVLRKLMDATFEQGKSRGQHDRRGSGSGVRSIHSALVQSAMCAHQTQSPSGVLLERVTDRRIDWLELECPHQDDLVEVGQVADQLCELHSAWRAGYAAGWDQSVQYARLTREARLGRCRFSIEARG